MGCKMVMGMLYVDYGEVTCGWLFVVGRWRSALEKLKRELESTTNVGNGYERLELKDAFNRQAQHPILTLRPRPAL